MKWFKKNTNLLEMQFSGQLPKPTKTGVDWFLFNYFLKKYKNDPMLELGVGSGGSAFTMLHHTNDLTTVDSWKYGYDKAKFVDLLNQNSLNVTQIEIDTQQFQSSRQFSFIHLDADKEYTQIINTLNNVSKICSGVICVDDYLQSLWPEISWAVDDWVSQSNWKRFFVGNHQVFLTKNNINIKEIIATFPLAINSEGYQITYGKLPNNDNFKRFVDNGVLKYTWHDIQQLDKNLIP